MPNEQTIDKEIIYIGDPMCSWCWGFAPVADRLRERFEGTAAFRLLLGGLRPGESAQPLDDGLKKTIEPHWRRVEELTGQPFDYAFFARQGFLFDTEPPSRAVVAVRRLVPELTFPFFISLEEAFYTRNVDITQPDSYAPVLEQHGMEHAAFFELFEDPDVRLETYRDFDSARRLGARGFPTVVLRKGREMGLLTVGYQPYERLLAPVERFFSVDAGRPEGEQQS